MEGNVKPDRRHGTTAPQARTRRTRASVVDAARSLFEERGYAATTIEAISERSDTPQATIYRLFASKLGILKAVIDVAIVGDDEDVAMADRPQVRELLADADAHQRLAQFAALLRDLMARTAPIHRLLADAARSDPEAASLLAEIARQRQEGQQRVARSLARAGALREGLRERDAADVIHALASPEVYGLLVLDREWSGERYEPGSHRRSPTSCSRREDRSAPEGVVHVRGVGRRPDLADLEVEVLVEAVEERLAGTEHDRRGGDDELVDVARGDGLADDVGAPADRDVAVAGHRLGLLEGTVEVADEGEAGRGIGGVVGAVGEHEEGPGNGLVPPQAPAASYMPRPTMAAPRLAVMASKNSRSTPVIPLVSCSVS